LGWNLHRRKAVSKTAGEETFYSFEAGSAYNTLQKKWADTFVIRIAHDMEDKGRHPLRPMRLRLPTSTNSKEFGLSYYIKIDVEGNELSSISGLSQAVPFLSFEVNLPEFRNNTIRCIEHLNHLSPRGATFNWCSSSKMVSERWLAAGEITNWVETTTLKYPLRITSRTERLSCNDFLCDRRQCKLARPRRAASGEK
jgi:hypothetical protein